MSRRLGCLSPDVGCWPRDTLLGVRVVTRGVRVVTRGASVVTRGEVAEGTLGTALLWTSVTSSLVTGETGAGLVTTAGAAIIG